jgi:dCMP deaminase
MNSKWDIRFLSIAATIASWSKDPSTQVGAVIVNPKSRNILSVGYNGFPTGMKDNTRLYDRDLKNDLMVHAEMNAIYNATANGVQIKDAWIYVNGLPVCSQCALGIIQTGINKVIMPKQNIPDRWMPSWKKSSAYFEEAGIESEFIDYDR